MKRIKLPDYVKRTLEDGVDIYLGEGISIDLDVDVMEATGDLSRFPESWLEYIPDQLKPCPFCGGESDMVETQVLGDWVTCKNCGSSSVIAKDENSAIEVWNRRV